MKNVQKKVEEPQVKPLIRSEKVIVSQRPFRWTYTAKTHRKNIYQMTFGDYLMQQYQKGE